MRMRKNKSIFAIILSLVFATSMLFASMAEPVMAEENGDDSEHTKTDILLQMLEGDEDDDDMPEGHGVHKNRETFEKNFDLSIAQKEYTITEIENVAASLDPDLSDLEKYYLLALWANQRVEYDWEFWCGGYDFDYYSHQWDSYGAMKEDEKSVCVGIAIFYSHLCHAADLPCKFVRLDPNYLDHTISYVPDINGNAYYADITENAFLMSEKSSNSFGEFIDKACEFATITKDCTEATFDYYDSEDYDEDGELDLISTNIKEFYDVPFEDWFNEYALHENTDKTFGAEYEELGSGLPRTDPESFHASYTAYPSNFTANPKIWFLDDFYKNPADIETKIRNKEFDGQLLDVSGLKKNYDCDLEDIEDAVADDLSLRYFPSVDNNEIVAKGDDLTLGEDYQVIYDGYDADKRTATLTIKGVGDYEGTGGNENTYQINVKMKSAVVLEAPVVNKELVYNEEPQELVTPGEAADGCVMQYGIGTKTEPPEEFTETVPTATDAGKYYVWYRAVGDETHGYSDPQYVGKAAVISPMQVSIIVDNVRIKVGETATLSPRLDVKMPVTFTFVSMDEETATVDARGVVTGIEEGSAVIYVEAHFKNASPNYEVADGGVVIVRVMSDIVDIEDTRVVLSQTDFTYNGEVQRPVIEKIKRLELEEGTDYTATWSDESSTDVGTYTVTIEGKGNYVGTTDATYTISKAANPMTLKPNTIKVKNSSLKKKTKTYKRSKAFTVSKAQGKLSYKLVSAKKGKKSFKSKFKVSTKTGTVTVKRGLGKGTYKVKVNVKAAGDANYKASAWKPVTFKVRVY